MLEKKRLFVCLFIVMYLSGLVIGSIYQVKIKEQAEMYEYLTLGVSGYDKNIAEGITCALSDNIPELFVMLLCAFLPFGVYVIGGVLSIRGFLSGFALTCALRTFGFSGLVLCLGTVLSSAITASLYVGYGIFVRSRKEGIGTVKLGLLSLLFLCAVLLFDGALKGTFGTVSAGLLR